MQKTLLINPPFNVSKEKYDTSISVGLLSIATYLDSKGIKVKIIDGARQENYLDLLKNEIKNYDIAGLSVMTTQIPGALEISKLIRKTNPQCQIVWGGAHPTFFPEKTAEHSLVDIVCFGEGELTMLDLAQEKDLAEIKGIVYKKDGRIVANSPQALHNPAQMPLFKWDLEPKEVLEKLTLIPSLTSRGCPHRCTFCINAILKNNWRGRTVEQVLKDLKIIKEKEYFRGKNLRFWDENFFVDLRRSRAIIDGMIERKLEIPWETTIRANYVAEGPPERLNDDNRSVGRGKVDDDFLEKMKKSGCYLLSFGAESGCPRILKKIKKDINPQDILRSAKMALRRGIIPQYSFMIGLPGEERSDMMATLDLIDELIKLSPEIQILGPQAFRPYPGSELYEECIQAGWKEPQSLEEWASLAENELSYLAVKNFPWVKDKDFVESMEAYVRFGAHSVKSAMGSSVKAQKLLKLGFILLCKLRWKLKFFKWPIEFKLAKRFVTK
ncbi:MAG: cobalamin B12-binding domain-containing protein [Candidatus Terrybacteria bacterium]|nr:cobalamin B12-binding domain-containing protein [Candidatus Terrybacteria bacterium]